MQTLLSTDRNSEIQTITALILKTVTTEKVFLLGSAVTQKNTETIFSKDVSFIQSPVSLFLLIIIKENNHCNEVQDKIENLCRGIISITAFVFTIKQFNEWCKEGHPFAQAVITKAQLLYGDACTNDATQMNSELFHKEMHSYYAQGLNKVQEFLCGADLYRIRKQNNMAAFMLQQSAEHALLTILKLSTGLHIVTHNIDKLVRYCSMIDYEVQQLFPRNNEKNERLFKLLNKAYHETRYQNDYSINVDELLILTECIRALQEIMKKVVSRKSEVRSQEKGIIDN
jgi:HEPN domain-containing protein